MLPCIGAGAAFELIKQHSSLQNLQGEVQVSVAVLIQQIVGYGSCAERRVKLFNRGIQIGSEACLMTAHC